MQPRNKKAIHFSAHLGHGRLSRPPPHPFWFAVLLSPGFGPVSLLMPGT